MSISRSQVGCLLLILLSISVMNHQVLGARYVKEVEHVLNKYAVWRKSFSSSETNGGSYATANRVVPSSPDPLHNRIVHASQDYLLSGKEEEGGEGRQNTSSLFKFENMETMLLDHTSLQQQHAQHQWQHFDMECLKRWKKAVNLGRKQQ
ncbi:hypothetical protein E2542_SST11336 [Spatholobus suberectus]|nr:hypothetical protein E2542_SST11336 [Spatholobus suberectus]